MCVSPYPHINKSPTNTCLYWIGRYADGKFDLDNAKGGFLHIGCKLSAPAVVCSLCMRLGRLALFAGLTRRCLMKTMFHHAIAIALLPYHYRAVPAGPGRCAVRAQLLQGRRRAVADAGLVPGAGRPRPFVWLHLLRLPHAAAHPVPPQCDTFMDSCQI